MKKNTFLLWSVLMICLGLFSIQSGNAVASSITGLFNTGIGASGTPDPYYTIAQGFTASIGRSSAHGGADDSWQYPSGQAAEWIALNPYTPGTHPALPFYTFSIEFDLTGYDPASASFDVRWMMDNSGYASLNGNEIAVSRSGHYPGGWYGAYNDYDPNHYGFQAPNLVSFSNNQFFQAGINRLNFIVLNGGGPVGLYVEFTNTNVNPVPTPTTLLLFGTGLAGLASVGRRKK